MKRPSIKLIKDSEITDHTYYEDCMYMSNSMLKMFMEKCPKHYAYRLENPIKTTQAMKFGTAFHMLVLESLEVFEKHYVVEPDVDKRTTLGKTTLAKFNEHIGDRIPITVKDQKTMMSMFEQLSEHNNIDILLQCKERESIYLWENKTAGMLCKGKFDAVNHDKKYIVDLKTTRNASPEKFKELLMNAKYHMQAAYYLDALGYSDYFIIAIEKDRPHCVCTYKLSKEMIQEGRKLYMDGLKSYKKIIKNDDSYMLEYNLGKICKI